MLDYDQQQLAVNSICHAADMASAAFQDAARAYDRPSAIYRPGLSIDGDKWCALYGANLQDGVCGFGDSPAAAMWDFDKAWCQSLGKQDGSKG